MRTELPYRQCPPDRRAVVAALAALPALAACADGATGPSKPPHATKPSPVAAPSAEWMRAASTTEPRSTGLDPQRLRTLDTAAKALPQLNSLIVARDGQTYLERAYRNGSLDRPANIKSASKSVLSAVVGTAVGAGTLALDTEVLSLLGGRPDGADPRVADLTLEHLLSMRAGLQSTSGRNYGRWAVSEDPVRHALTRPMVDVPGGRMIYSTGTSHLASAVLTAAEDRSTLAVARARLGDPLGITIPAWGRDPKGIYWGGNEMAMSPRALLRIGELFRRGGEIDGERILSAEWIARSWTPVGRSRWSGDGYGLGWWLRDVRPPGARRSYHTAYAWGYGGQMLYIVPELGITATMLSRSAPSETRRGHVRSLHALLRDHIVPAAVEGGRAEPV